MSLHPDNLTWTRSDVPIRIDLDDDTDYSMFDDDHLRAERDRQRQQLDELVLHPGGSPAVALLRQSLEGEIDRMTDELRRRARSRHPSSRSVGGRLRSWRPLS